MAGPYRRAGDERRGLADLAGRIVTSPGTMVRALIFIGVLLVLVLAAAGLFSLKIDVGPVHVGPAVTTSGV
ncbi:hypothetical protein OHS58_33995 [Amycolatopsis sp. NBC_00348]|uniref:hypothetical protein n=1 Tax=Amycolatopsis sp. NBC_00348 TaxID=2975956 RepID=UPI002E25DED8